MSQHWNNHIVCALDIETTGLDASKQCIWQIAVLPLKPDLTPRTDISPFYTDMAPEVPPHLWEPGAVRMAKTDLAQLFETGPDPYKVADLFDEWFQKLNLPFRKKIMPLAHNFPFEQAFLSRWLGHVSYDAFFFGYRDTMTIANMLNDIADMHNEPWPFPKVSLSYLCSQMGIENMKPHDALGDAMACAECYRRMVTTYKIY